MVEKGKGRFYLEISFGGEALNNEYGLCESGRAECEDFAMGAWSDV